MIDVGDQWVTPAQEVARIVREAQQKGIPYNPAECAWCNHPPSMVQCKCGEDCGKSECLAGANTMSSQPGVTRVQWAVPVFDLEPRCQMGDH